MKEALILIARACLITVVLWQTKEGFASKLIAAAGIVSLSILSFLEGRLV